MNSPSSLLQQVTRSFLIFAFIYEIIFLYEGFHSAFLYCLGSIALFTLVLVLNHFGHRKTAKSLLVVSVTLTFMVLSEGFRDTGDFHLLFYAFIGLPLIFFKSDSKLLRYGLTLFVFSIALLSQYTEWFYAIPPLGVATKTLQILNFFAPFFSIAVQLIYVTRNYLHAEASLKQSVETLNNAQSLASIGNWEWNAQTNQVKWSNELYKIYQCNPITFVPSFEAFAAMIHPDDHLRIMQTLEVNRQIKEAFSFTHRIVLGSEIKYIAQLGSWSQNDLGEEVIRGVTQDVTATAVLQEELKTSEAHSRQILDTIPDFVIVKGPKSKLVWGNKSFREYYGMTNEELQGMIDAPFNEPDYTQQYIKDDAQVFQTGIPLEIYDEPVVRKDGVTRFFHTVKTPIFDHHHQVTQLVVISRDITANKETASLLEQQRAKMIASSKMSALGEMTGNIAHEINNPLAIIHTRSSQLKELAEAGELTSEFISTTADSIESTVMRISKIIKSLRTFSRNAEKDPYETVSVKALIADTVELCIQRYRNAKIELKIPLVEDNLKLECQSVQISQVLLNLLNNACDAVATLNEKWVSLDVVRKGDSILIRVTDSGHGITDEVRAKIMTPFFTTKEVGKGIGLGLSISKGIIESHQGRLTIEPGSAHTCFQIEMPLGQTKETSKDSA